MTLAPATPLADVLEREWQAQVIDLATTFGFKTYHTYDSRRSAHGWPDLALLRERLILVECKREKGKLSVHQQAWLRALLDAGCEAYVARPRHLQALATVLAHRGRPWEARGPVVDVAAGLREELRSLLRETETDA